VPPRNLGERPRQARVGIHPGDQVVVELRERMVARQIAGRGVRDAAVIAAMREVPRERFVPAPLASLAYEDQPLAIGEGQTISQPYVVAAMAEALELHSRDRVLEVGTGSGYAAAVLATIVAEVYTIERLEGLATSADRRLAGLGYANVHVRHGDGSLGWPEHAPYDAIVVTTSAPDVPTALLQQLKIGGRLVIPVGPKVGTQRLVRIVRTSDEDYARQTLEKVVFVPLIGAEGWSEGEEAE
jgi:protein-L-isoaspartate(D-aspartate) O-methyltransferase